jgi:glycogen debranching enzyme
VSHLLKADPSDISRPVHVDLPISAPGAFCYYIEYDGRDGKRISSRRGYFNVDPIITLPARTPFFPHGTVPSTSPLTDASSGAVLDKPTSLTLDGLTILSVLAKWMGTTSAWDKHFSEASKRGYNMLHWAPLQQRGSSGSPYSIYDQLKYDKAILDSPEAKDGGLAEIEKAVQYAREKYGLGGITDVVLNHTAFDSPWLQEHPEAGERDSPIRKVKTKVDRLLPIQHAAFGPSRRVGDRAPGPYRATTLSRTADDPQIPIRSRSTRAAYQVGN